LRELYAAFNAHDLDTAPAGMSDDVDWPNGWEGGRVHGREAARSYWTRQWAELDSRAEPVTISTRPRREHRSRRPPGRAQPDRRGPGDGRVLHIYELCDGLVARMDIEQQAAVG
jgi:hypothetical protein